MAGKQIIKIQQNKLEVYKRRAGRRAAGRAGGRSEAVGAAALDQWHLAQLHNGRARLVLHLGHPLHQLLGFAVGVSQLLLPLHQLWVTVALQDKLLATSDLEEEALSLLDLRLLHRLDLLHGQQALRGLALAPPLEPVGEQVEVPPLPLGQEGVAHLGHVAMHDAVLAQGVVFLVAQLLVFGFLAGLQPVCLSIDGVKDSLCYLLLPPLRDGQGEVAVELLVTVQ